MADPKKPINMHKQMAMGMKKGGKVSKPVKDDDADGYKCGGKVSKKK